MEAPTTCNTLSPQDNRLTRAHPHRKNKTKKSMDEAIVKLINTDYSFLCQGLLTIYNNQTATERVLASSINKNGLGFSSVDARGFSEMAQHLIAVAYLTDDHIRSCRQPMKSGIPRLGKYRRQLYELYELRHGGEGEALQ